MAVEDEARAAGLAFLVSSFVCSERAVSTLRWKCPKLSAIISICGVLIQITANLTGGALDAGGEKAVGPVRHCSSAANTSTSVSQSEAFGWFLPSRAFVASSHDSAFAVLVTSTIDAFVRRRVKSLAACASLTLPIVVLEGIERAPTCRVLAPGRLESETCSPSRAGVTALGSYLVDEGASWAGCASGVATSREEARRANRAEARALLSGKSARSTGRAVVAGVPVGADGALGAGGGSAAAESAGRALLAQAVGSARREGVFVAGGAPLVVGRDDEGQTRDGHARALSAADALGVADVGVAAWRAREAGCGARGGVESARGAAPAELKALELAEDALSEPERACRARVASVALALEEALRAWLARVVCVLEEALAADALGVERGGQQDQQED